MGKVKNIEQYGWNGLKAQKLLAQGNGHNQHALKGQKLIAQGNGHKQHALKGQKLLAQGNGHKQHALKGQKLLAQGNGHKQHALKGQKLLAQGIALGIVTVSNAPCKGKSFINFRVSFKAFALTGRQVCEHDNPGRCPGLRASAPSGRAASMSFCPLPLLYPSARDFQFRYASVTAGSGRAASMNFCPYLCLTLRPAIFNSLRPVTVGSGRIG